MAGLTVVATVVVMMVVLAVVVERAPKKHQGTPGTESSQQQLRS